MLHYFTLMFLHICRLFWQYVCTSIVFLFFYNLNLMLNEFLRMMKNCNKLSLNCCYQITTVVQIICLFCRGCCSCIIFVDFNILYFKLPIMVYRDDIFEMVIRIGKSRIWVALCVCVYWIWLLYLFSILSYTNSLLVS